MRKSRDGERTERIKHLVATSLIRRDLTRRYLKTHQMVFTACEPSHGSFHSTVQVTGTII